MTITFDENGVQTAWALTAEEERLLNVIRIRLTEKDPVTKEDVLKFDSVRELIHQNVIDAFLVPAIQEETRVSFQASLDAALSDKIGGIPKPTKVLPGIKAAEKAAADKTLFEKFKSFIGME